MYQNTTTPQHNKTTHFNLNLYLLIPPRFIKGEGGLPEDWQEAFIWFERSSIQGYVFAQFHLAYMYFRVRRS